MKNKNQSITHFSNSYQNTIGLILILFVVILWITLAIPLIYMAYVDDDRSGKLGDTFGIINSFFSALGFAAITYTLIQQNRTIRQQEIDTRIDRFDSKFFQMLQAQRDIVNGIDLKGKVRVFPKGGNVGEIIKPEIREKVTKGRDCFKIFYNQHFVNSVLAFAIEKNNYAEIDAKELSGKCTQEELIKVFEDQFFPKYESDLGHYFRHLFHTIKLLENASFIENKKEYVGILRAQLSTYELLLLFYNGLSFRGKEFLPLMIKYDLMKSMNEDLLINGYDDWKTSVYFKEDWE